MIQIENIPDESSFGQYKNQWDSFLDQSQTNSIFLSHGWLHLWWRIFACNKSLAILLAKEKDKLRGIAPLMIQKTRYRGVPVQCISFLENKEAPHNDFITGGQASDHDAIIARFLNELTTSGKKYDWDLISLRGIPDGSPSLQAIMKYCTANKYPFTVQPGLVSPILTIKSDWENYYKNTSQRFKKRMRYNQNKLKKGGEIVVERLDKPPTIEATYDELLALDQQTWKAHKKIGLSSRPETREFFRQLPKVLAPVGTAVLWLLRLSGKAIAYEYHIRQNGVVYSLRAGFDSNFQEYAPGTVLDFFVVQSLFGDNISLYNMCGSADDYKLHWTTQCVKHFNLTIFNKRFKSLLLAVDEKYFLPGLKKMKRLLTSRSS